MALRKYRARLAFIWLLSGWFGIAAVASLGEQARADDGWSEARLVSVRCRMTHLKGAKAERLKFSPWGVGIILRVRDVPNRPGFAQVREGDDFYIIEKSCLDYANVSEAPSPQQARPRPTQPSLASSAAELPRRALAWRGAHYTLSYISWMEALTLRSTTGGADLVVQANQIGFCPGIGWLREWKPSVGVGLDLCLPLMRSQTGLETQKTIAGWTYQATNSWVLGVAMRPTIVWQPEGGGFELFGGFNFMFRRGNWPQPTGYSFSQSTAFVLGPELGARYRRGNWFLGQRVGFIKSASWLSWALEFGFGT